jgi:hypothetical protein
VLDLVVHRADMPFLPGNAWNLPRLGFGLWSVPAASAAVELALVVVGAYLYWGAASKTLRDAGRPTTKSATGIATLLLVSGLVTLGLNLAGM